MEKIECSEVWVDLLRAQPEREEKLMRAIIFIKIAPEKHFFEKINLNTGKASAFSDHNYDNNNKLDCSFSFLENCKKLTKMYLKTQSFSKIVLL